MTVIFIKRIAYLSLICSIRFILKRNYFSDFDVGPKPCDLGVTHFQTVMSLVISALKDSLNEHGSRSFGEQLLQIALQHLNRLLT